MLFSSSAATLRLKVASGWFSRYAPFDLLSRRRTGSVEAVGPDKRMMLEVWVVALVLGVLGVWVMALVLGGSEGLQWR